MPDTYKTIIVVGSEDRHYFHVEYDTEDEMNAYLQGLDDGAGWMEAYPAKKEDIYHCPSCDLAGWMEEALWDEIETDEGTMEVQVCEHGCGTRVHPGMGIE
jgi:hypothetical protein